MEYNLTLPLPPSVNHYLVHTRRGVYQTPEAVAYKTQVGYAANNLTPLEGDLIVVLEVYGSQLDIDNIPKCVLDALNGRAWKDDGQIVELHTYKHKAKKRDGRVEISVWVK